MPLDSKHPKFSEFFMTWQKLRDCYAGQDEIKAKGEVYLPPTPGHLIDGMGTDQRGRKNYQAYKMRAVFPEYVEAAVQETVGVMHQKPAIIDLPPQLEPLRKRATVDGEDLLGLLRRINEAQLLTGRIGMMLDLPSDQPRATLPYVATYDAERIINWDDGSRTTPTLQTLNLVVLEETENERTADLEWERTEKFRVLVLGDVTANEFDGVYRQGVFRETRSFNESALIVPSLQGKTLDQVPFVFVNPSDLLPEPMKPPLLKLANLCLTIYRGEADYRLNLFMQAQDTLVVIGGDDDAEYRIGAGASINPPPGGDAKFIGVNSGGLPEQRQALENDYRRAAEIAGQLLDTTSRMKESGAALQTRVAAQTVTLHQVALTSAAGMERILKMAAIWAGADPEKVKVSPNVDFVGTKMTPGDYVQLVSAKSQGLPLSDESVHAQLKKDEYTAKEFAEEMKLIEDERKAADARKPKIEPIPVV